LAFFFVGILNGVLSDIYFGDCICKVKDKYMSVLFFSKAASIDQFLSGDNTDEY